MQLRARRQRRSVHRANGDRPRCGSSLARPGARSLGQRRIVFNDDTFSGEKASVETSYHPPSIRFVLSEAGSPGTLTRNLASSSLRSLPENDLRAGDEVQLQTSGRNRQGK